MLDSLCAKAVTCFSILDSDTAAELTKNGHYGQTAIMFTPGQSFVFGRPDLAADDVTCAVIDSAQDVEQALHTIRDTVSKIGENGR